MMNDLLAADEERSSSPADDVVSLLSIQEKLSLLTGATMWKLARHPKNTTIPPLTLADGPHGLRKPLQELSLHESFPATSFPTAAALACSWNVDVVQRVGETLRDECRHLNVQILLGPGMNLKRHPSGGRTFEYWSEDPYVTGTLAAAFITGIQAGGHVGACAKHYCINNQESHRFVVDGIVDDRTCQELYTRHFEAVVKQAQPATIMCAYNKVNGVYCSEHAQLITGVLRNQFGFEGVVMTDWGATNDRVAGIQAGLDLEMPGSHGVHDSAIQQALKDGRLEMDQLDQCCRRMINLMQRYTAYEKDQDAAEKHPVDWEKHFNVALQVAMECAVLLRNENQFLPLAKGTSVAVIGDFARDHPRYQGMGSSRVYSQKVVTVYDELKRYTDTIHFAPGYLADDDHPELVNRELIDQAVETAKKASVVLLCIGLPEIMESEGFDRPHLGLPAQHNALVEAVSTVNSNVVVILSNGGVVELPWHDQVQAILEGYLLGEAGGAAVVDLIFGMQSPSGKLAETFPITVQNIPADQFFPGSERRVEYREGLNVGYRYFDTAQKPVRYPFGHGLSYTTFAYENLQLELVEDDNNSIVVDVSFQLTNTGSVVGKEVAQCYVHDVHASVYRPTQELRDFTKVELQPGESRPIKMRLTTAAFSFYDIGVLDWVVEEGVFEIRIGSSSRDIRLRGQIDIQKSGVQEASELARESYPPVDERGVICPMDDLSFAKRFGKSSGFALADLVSIESDGFHRNTLLKEISRKRLIGRILLSLVYREASRDIVEGPARNRQKKMVKANVENLPLRVLVLFSKGNFTFELLDACISLMNGLVFTALRGFGRGFVGMFRRR
jgi:beta-glucosidase